MAVERYRTAVGDHSRTLPAYLRVADAAALALRARRAIGRSGRAPVEALPEPDVPVVSAAAISEAGELSFVLTGTAAWRRTIDGVALRRRGELRALEAMVHAAAGVIRLNAVLPADPAFADWDVVLVDADGEPLDLPAPELGALRRTAADG